MSRKVIKRFMALDKMRQTPLERFWTRVRNLYIMPKYHINNEGELGVCTASKQACKFSANEHFADKQDAEVYFANRYDTVTSLTKRKEGKLFSNPIPGLDSTGEKATVFDNGRAQVRTVPSRYGSFTVVGKENAGGAAILTVRGGKILMVKQPRYAIGQETWELPRGGSQEGESNLSSASRELSEETGVSTEGENITSLGDIHPDTGALSARAGLYFVDLDSVPADKTTPVDGEVDNAEWVDADEVVNAVLDGRITDSFTMVAVMKARLKGLL